MVQTHVPPEAIPLIKPVRLWSRSEILSGPEPPAAPGVYAWYFRQIPPGVPTEGCIVHDGLTLLYVGISPKAAPLNGRPASRQNLRTRLRYHMRGNAEGSTLRLTLGCLLAKELGVELRRVGSGSRMTFGTAGEAKLSGWLDRNACVSWVVTEEPWEVEQQVIQHVALPLNLDENKQHPFHAALTEIRRAAKARAGELPVLHEP
jgi:hypothetical protein